MSQADAPLRHLAPEPRGEPRGSARAERTMAGRSARRDERA